MFHLLKIYDSDHYMACQLEITKRNTILYGKPVNDFSKVNTKRILLRKCYFCKLLFFTQNNQYKSSFAKHLLDEYIFDLFIIRPILWWWKLWMIVAISLSSIKKYWREYWNQDSRLEWANFWGLSFEMSLDPVMWSLTGKRK